MQRAFDTCQWPCIGKAIMQNRTAQPGVVRVDSPRNKNLQRRELTHQVNLAQKKRLSVDWQPSLVAAHAARD